MNTNGIKSVLGERLAAVEERIQAACTRSRRRREDITLIAVTKTVAAPVAAAIAELGIFDLGESRPQELWNKFNAVKTAGVRWHLIGHCQRNKIERTLPLVERIHSVDSLRLLAAIEKEACRGLQLGKIKPRVLLEFNASGEASKGGFAPADLPAIATALLPLTHVEVDGLMTMAAFETDPQKTRPTFALLRNLRDQLQHEVGNKLDLKHLSMGMTNDFEIAIEEGATLIRLGTVLFEGLDSHLSG